MPVNERPPGGAEPELQFVDRATAEQASGQLEVYADRAPTSIVLLALLGNHAVLNRLAVHRATQEELA